MNPRDYKTWTAFADHPIFSDLKHDPAAWSSDPALYDDFMMETFDISWYTSREPPEPNEIQEACAARDIRNLVETCRLLEERFGRFEHELFVLDDLTTFVRIESPVLKIRLESLDYGDGCAQTVILDLYRPIEAELIAGTASEVALKLFALIDNL